MSAVWGAGLPAQADCSRSDPGRQRAEPWLGGTAMRWVRGRRKQPCPQAGVQGTACGARMRLATLESVLLRTYPELGQTCPDRTWLQWTFPFTVLLPRTGHGDPLAIPMGAALLGPPPWPVRRECGLRRVQEGRPADCGGADGLLFHTSNGRTHCHTGFKSLCFLWVASLSFTPSHGRVGPGANVTSGIQGHATLFPLWITADGRRNVPPAPRSQQGLRPRQGTCPTSSA